MAALPDHDYAINLEPPARRVADITICEEKLTMNLILLIIVIILLIGALPTWPYSAGWGYYPSGGLGLVLLILIILLLLGRI